MADINNELNKVGNSLDTVREKAMSTAEAVDKLEKELNTKTIRITPELIGENVYKEEDRTITKLTNSIKEYKEEIASIKSIEINDNNAEEINNRIIKLNEKIDATKNNIKEMYEIAANFAVEEFNTSKGAGLKSKLNSDVRNIYTSVSVPEQEKKVNDAALIASSAEVKITDKLTKDFENALKQFNNEFKNFRLLNKEEVEKLSDDEKKKYYKIENKYKDLINKYNNTYEDETLKIFQDEIQKSFGKTIKLGLASYKENGLLKDLDVNTLGMAIYNEFPSKGEKILDAIYKTDLIEANMGSFTKSNVVDASLMNNPEGLLFGTEYNFSDLQEKIEEKEKFLDEEFPEGINTPPLKEFGQTVEDVQNEYNNLVTEIAKLKNNMESLSEQLNATGGYISMYEKAKAADYTFKIPNDISERMQFEKIKGEELSKTIQDAYDTSLKPTNIDITAKQIETKVVDGYKEAINKIQNLENAQNVPLLQKILGEDNKNSLSERIENHNKKYNELRENIQNTPIDIKTTGASFNTFQIEQYQDSLDDLIVEGNKLREIMVDNFNQINSAEIAGIKDISIEWNDFVNKATSEKRLQITDDDSIAKLRLIDDIMKDIKKQASEFVVYDNKEAKLYNTLVGSTENVKKQIEDFGKGDKQFVINDIEIQRLKIALDLLNQLREKTSDARHEDFSIEKTKNIDNLRNVITKRISELTGSNNKIQTLADSLGIKIEEAPKINYSQRIGTATNESIEKYIKNIKLDEDYRHAEEIQEANSKNDEVYKRRSIELENKRHNNVLRDLREEEAAYKKIFKLADSDYNNQQLSSIRAQAERQKQKEAEAKTIDEINSKLYKYNQQLEHTDTTGLDKVIKKLEVYNKEIDIAIQKNNLARATSIMKFYEDTFSSIKGIKKGQEIAVNKKVKEEAEAEKAQAEAEKAQAIVRNNYINKKNEEAKIIDNIKSKMYEYNQQLAHIDTTGLDKVINKLGIYNRELDNAIKKGDIARASNIFGLYENQFESIAGIKKGQQIASNEEAKRQAELVKTQAESEKEQAKAAEEREKVLREEQTIRSKIAEMQSKNKAKEDLDATKAAEEREKVLREEQTIRSKIAEIQSREQATAQKQAEQDATKAAEERERVLREEQTIRSKIAEMQSKNEAKEDLDATKKWEEQVNNIKNKVQEVTNTIKQAISNTIKIIRTANNIVNKSISLMIGAFEKLGSTVQRIIQIFGNFGNRIGLVNKQGNILKGTYTELKSKIDLLVGAFNKLYNNSFINEGKKLLSSVQTLNMLLGTELTNRTMEWAESLEHAFGLSAAGLISDLKELTAVMYGLGMTANDVQMAATNLEAVAMSLSATTGYDFSTVVNKIQSGMKGMTQSIDDLGLSVRESQMDAFLKKLKAQGGEYANIGTSFSQLEEQQRIYVRYAAIMDQFTSKEAYSAENYAKSLRTITGSLSILNSQIRGLKSDIGALALQLFAKIIQPLIYIIYLVRTAVASIAELLGIDITLNPNMNNNEENIIAPIEDTTKALEDEAAAADKAKGSLDALDHVSTMSESSGKNKDNFDYSSLMNISDDYASLLADLGKMQDDFLEECKKKFWDMVNDIKDKFTSWIKDVTGRIIDWDLIKENWDTIVENLKKTWDNIVRIFNASIDIIGGLLYNIFDDLDATTLLAKFSATIEKFTDLIATILERVQPYIQEFYDKYLSKYVEKFGDWLEEKIDNINAKLDEWLGWWENEDNNGAIQEWFDNLGKRFEEVAVSLKALFKGKDSINDDDLKVIDGMGDGMSSVYGIALDLHDIFSDVFTIVKDTATNLLDLNGDGELNFEDVKLALAEIKEKLDDVKTWLNENKDKISNLLTEIGNTLAKLAEAKFEVLEKLFRFIVENEETISAVLRTIQDIIDKCAEHPVLAIGLSVAGQTALGTGKTILTALMWKKILGLGAGGPAINAAKEGGIKIAENLIKGIEGSKIGGTISGILGKAGLFGGTIGSTILGGGAIAGAAYVTYEGIKEAGNIILDSVQDVNGVINKVNEETGEKLILTANDTKTYAYEIRRALTETYGKEIDTSAITRAVDLYVEDLRKAYNLTDEEASRLADSIEKQYNHLGKNLDGTLGTLLYSSDASKDHIKILSEAFKELDNITEGVSTTTTDTVKTTTDEIKNKTEEVANKTEEVKNKVTTNWDGIRGVYTTTTEEVKKATSDVSSSIQEEVDSTTSKITKNVDDLNQNVNSNVIDIKDNVESMKPSLEIALDDANSFKDQFIARFQEIETEVSRICQNLSAQISSIFSQVGIAVSQAESISQASAQVINSSAGWSTTKVLGFATGGLPDSGSLFMANENGNTELVGNFGGYAGVANQGMIIEAMQNAMVQAIRSAGGLNNQSGNLTINVGTWMGDEAGIRKLATKINNVNARSNSNIANVSFSMS